MSTGSPVNDYSIVGSLSVATASPSAAASAAASAISDINTALKTLANNTAFSVAEDPPGTIAFMEPDGNDGAFVAEGALLIGSVGTSTAQEQAEASMAAIATAISGVSPAVTVTLEEEQGQYVFSQTG